MRFSYFLRSDVCILADATLMSDVCILTDATFLSDVCILTDATLMSDVCILTDATFATARATARARYGARADMREIFAQKNRFLH